MAHGGSKKFVQEEANENNKLRVEDRAVHDWYRFVLSFPPHLVRSYLERFGIGPGATVLDPFCGTGTTLVECKKLGIKSVGIERNPMARFASKVKVNWSLSPDDLMDHASVIGGLTSRSLSGQGIEYFDLPLFSESAKAKPSLRTLTADASKLLLRDSISPIPLHKTLVLLNELRRNQDERFSEHEQLALAKTIVFGISNLHFGPEVGVGRAKSDAPVVRKWLENVRTMAMDLQALGERSRTESSVYQADSRDPGRILPPKSVDAVITSPPYPNEKDYTRTTRLESVILGFMHNRGDLQSIKKDLLCSNSRTVYKSDADHLLVADNPEIQSLADAIEQRRIELGKTSGFERMYARVTRAYFGGMNRHLAGLRNILRPGALLAYVVGDQASYLRVMIRTGQLLASIAASLGYEVVSIDLFRTRLATASGERLREEVVVLRWPGKRSKRGAAREKAK
jgi:hypothetical protein